MQGKSKTYFQKGYMPFILLYCVTLTNHLLSGTQGEVQVDTDPI